MKLSRRTFLKAITPIIIAPGLLATIPKKTITKEIAKNPISKTIPGNIEIFSGTPNGKSKLLATIPLDFKESDVGLSISRATSTTINKTGTASYFKLEVGTGYPRTPFIGTVGTNSSDLNMNNTALFKASTLNIDTMNIKSI